MNLKNIKIKKNILILLTLLSCILTPFTLSKYLTKSTGTGSALGATYVFDINESQSIVLENLDVNKEYFYNFEVSNTRDGETAEVVQNYAITINTTGNLPLDFYLYDDETGEYIGKMVTENLENNNLFLTNNTITLSGGVLPYSQSESHKYKLKIILTEIDEDIMKFVDLITIEIKSEQSIR